MSFQGKTALVTGGARGIGAGIAARFLELGVKVMIADTREPESASDAIAANCDVSDEGSVASLAEKIASDFGRLDALVNNAGIADAGSTPIEELPLEAWNRVLATNLTGIFLVTKHTAPLLRDARGSIINIASTRAGRS